MGKLGGEDWEQGPKTESA